jgi:hypothetical protein
MRPDPRDRTLLSSTHTPGDEQFEDHDAVLQAERLLERKKKNNARSR